MTERVKDSGHDRERNETFERENTRLRTQLSARQVELQRVTEELEAIRTSPGYLAGQTLWRWRQRLLPNGGAGARALAWLTGRLFGRRTAAPAKSNKIYISESLSAPARPGETTNPSNTQPARQMRQNRKVNIVIQRFFDANGNSMYCGGAERYVLELARLIRDLGGEPEVFQAARAPWVRYYGDLRVTGIDCGRNEFELNERFHAAVPAGALTLYNAFFTAHPHTHPRSLVIGHGIYWDHAKAQNEPRPGEEGRALAVMERTAGLISVDTNTINFVREHRAELAQKAQYIPNFVDLSVFRPMDPIVSKKETNERLVVLFPRRLCEPRGFWLLHAIAPALLENNPQVDLHFVGKADPAEEAAVLELIAKHPGRVQWYFLPPGRMPEAYQRARITLIPSLHSEGTSLSCLEAQACGNTVIATHVGGLANLIFNDVNGVLIEPAAADLQAAIERLIGDAELRNSLGRQARKIAETFNIARWRKHWTTALQPYLPAGATPRRPRPVFLFPSETTTAPEPQQAWLWRIATDLAQWKLDVYWVVKNKCNENNSLENNHYLHTVGREDDLYLEQPVVVLTGPTDPALASRYPNSINIGDLLDEEVADAANSMPPGRLAWPLVRQAMRQRLRRCATSTVDASINDSSSH